MLEMVRYYYIHHKYLLKKSFPQGFIFHHGEFANEYLGKIWVNYILIRFHYSWKVFSGHGLRCWHCSGSRGEVVRCLCDVLHEAVVLLF